MIRPPILRYIFSTLEICFGVGCFVLAIEYTGVCRNYWGQGYFVAPDIFYQFPLGKIEDLGVRYVGDVVLWWGASLILICRGLFRFLECLQLVTE